MKISVVPMLCFSAFASPTLSVAAPVQIRVTPEREYVHRESERDLVFRIDLIADDLASPRRTPIDLAVVLDRSGSMAGAKLEKARQAACVAIDQLSTRDRFCL